MRTLKGRLEVYRQEPRVLAGLEGMEIRLAMAPPGEPEVVRYTWHYPGLGGDGTRPRINIVAFTSKERRGELDGIWESILGSLAMVPPGVRK